MITCEMMGRLCNQMFIAATAYSLAIDNNVGTIRVGDRVVGTGISGDVTVKTIIDQNEN